jgi:DNA helicase II / ATP-dependent DNA helicase PcrA
MSVPLPFTRSFSEEGQDLASRALGALKNRRDTDHDPLRNLNPEQRRAVETTEGPVLVLAGAGTGKTRVLTTRIAHLLQNNFAWPSQVLAVTFTNKAAREMRERIVHLVGASAEGMPWLGTFHSVSTKIVRRHAELIGLRSDFTILDTDDQLRLLKQVITADGLDEKRWPARQLLGLIDGWKNRGHIPSLVPIGEAGSYGNGRGVALYTAYQERLKTLNACDFGDLLLHCITLWRQNKDVLQQYQERFKYMLVDEYQDTNVAQYLWLRLLAQKTDNGRKNICCVGDDDQSIYGWRGAEVDNILRFEHDFPGAEVIRLEKNYRSTGHILGAAACLIAHNEGRLGKTLHTDDELGEPVKILAAWDSIEEARLIGDEIEYLATKGHSYAAMAVLVRISAQMRELEERFIKLGLPYRVIGGPRFYERAEVRDALAYLRCVHSPTDDLAFERILNVPKRGLADATVQALNAIARQKGCSLMQAANEAIVGDTLKPKPRGALRELMQAFDRWRVAKATTPQNELAQVILEESGYTDMWQKERTPDSAGRLENLKELVRSLENFPDLGAFLEHVALVVEVSESDSQERVSIMTLHAAKGLEFDVIFLPGWEDGLFPNQRALDESGMAGLEEERRLAYVGLTRARKQSYIVFAANRRVHGYWQNSVPSRFLKELPEAHVEIADSVGSVTRTPTTPSRFETMEKAERRGSVVTINATVVASSRQTQSSQFAVGDRVKHASFGLGVVQNIEGSKLSVLFDAGKTYNLVDSFVEKMGNI